jgi:hypothetical protein
VGKIQKGLCFGPTPSRPSGPGVVGEMKLEGIKSNLPGAENIKKGTKSIVFWLFFKLPDCTSNNTYGELRFNVFYLELCQFVGGGQLGKALAYCFFKSIGSIFY